MNITKLVFINEISTIWTRKSDFIYSLLFYLSCIIVFKIGIGPYDFSDSIKISLVFTPLLLSIMLNTSLSFMAEYKSGILQQYILLPTPLEYVIIGKWLANNLIYLASIIVITPLACLFLDLSFSNLGQLIISSSLLCLYCTAMISLIGSVIFNSSLSSLIAIVIIPLLIPALILATLSVEQSFYGYLLLAICAFKLPIILYFNRVVLENSYHN